MASSYNEAVAALSSRGLTDGQAQIFVGEMSRRLVFELCERYDGAQNVGPGLLVTWLRAVSTVERSPVPARLVPQNEWERRKLTWAQEIASLKSLRASSVVGLGFQLEKRTGERPSVADIRREYDKRMAA